MKARVSTLAITAAFLTACGGSLPAATPTPATTATVAPSSTTIVAVTAARPTATQILPETEAPAATATQLVQATVQVATRAPATAAAAAALPLYNGIPHGVTADGFYYLGNPDAALTLIDYSDFL